MLMIIKGSEVHADEPRRYADDFADAEDSISQIIAGSSELQSWATADSPLAIVDRRSRHEPDAARIRSRGASEGRSTRSHAMSKQNRTPSSRWVARAEPGRDAPSRLTLTAGILTAVASVSTDTIGWHVAMLATMTQPIRFEVASGSQPSIDAAAIVAAQLAAEDALTACADEIAAAVRGES